MTRKSYARRQRDAYNNNNNGWDELQRLYSENQSLLNHIVERTKNFFGIENIALFIPEQERQHAANVIHTLSSDVANFQKRLNAIYDLHKDKSGKVHIPSKKESMEEANFEEYVQLVGIFEQYTQFTMDYSNILDPVFRNALGIMAATEQRIHDYVEKENKEKQAQTEAAEAASE